MVVFDSTFLLLVIDPSVPAPIDPATGKPYEKGRARIEHLIDRLSSAGTVILIPTPVLAEVLSGAGANINPVLSKIRGLPGFKIGDFDQKAAIETAVMTASALSMGNKRGAAKGVPWQKVKVDRQIVAIAKAQGAAELYCGDEGLCKLAAAENLSVVRIGDLPMPPIEAQGKLPLDDAAEAVDADP